MPRYASGSPRVRPALGRGNALFSRKGAVGGGISAAFLTGIKPRLLSPGGNAGMMRTILISGGSMYVCVCNGVTDRDIQGAVALGARTLADLGHSLGVGTCCGRCLDCARRFVGEPAEGPAPCSGGDD